jgi:hypothetical protein
MTLITLQDGKVVLRDGKVGTEQACCCGENCDVFCDVNGVCPEGCECNRIGCAYFFSPPDGQCPPGSEFIRNCPPGFEDDVECVKIVYSDDPDFVCDPQDAPFNLGNCNFGETFASGAAACGKPNGNPLP